MEEDNSDEPRESGITTKQVISQREELKSSPRLNAQQPSEPTKHSKINEDSNSSSRKSIREYSPMREIKDSKGVQGNFFYAAQD